MPLVRFNTPYQGYDPATIYGADEATKTLRPISSGEAYTGAGFNFGQESVADPNQFASYQLGTPITRAEELSSIKNQLMGYQDKLFNESTTTNKRQSSSIADSINSEQSNYDTYLSEYNDLRKKLDALKIPNYQQAYNDLRTQSGIPGIENDFANNQKSLRELPYVNRMNFGNAGVTTEDQLSADTSQKGIPLEIQQSNLLDRLKLAQDFINNSLKFKEMDTNASRQSLSDALSTVAQTIDFTRNHVNDLLSQQSAQQERDQLAQQFAYENRITQPFYDIGGTVYRTSDRMPAHNKAEYVSMGGKGDFSDVQKVDASKIETSSSVQKVGGRLVKIGFNKFGQKISEIDLGQDTSGNQWVKIGVDGDGNDIMGFANPDTKTVTPATPGTGSGTANLGNQTGTMYGLPVYDTLNANPGVAKATRNNNPLNIIATEGSAKYDGVIGIEKGNSKNPLNFLIFNSVEDGYKAAGNLMMGKTYAGLTAEQAIKRWNGNGGYGAKDVGLNPNQNFQAQIKDPAKREQVAQAMARAEGFKSSTSAPTANSSIENKLKASAGTDHKADPGVYVEIRSKTKSMSPDEFDKRYGYLLSAQEQKNLGIAGGPTAATDKFLSSQYFRSLYSADELFKLTGKSFGVLTRNKNQKKEQAINDYLNSLMDKVNAYRQAGYTDKEILQMMSK